MSEKEKEKPKKAKIVPRKKKPSEKKEDTNEKTSINPFAVPGETIPTRLQAILDGFHNVSDPLKDAFTDYTKGFLEAGRPLDKALSLEEWSKNLSESTSPTFAGLYNNSSQEILLQQEIIALRKQINTVNEELREESKDKDAIIEKLAKHKALFDEKLALEKQIHILYRIHDDAKGLIGNSKFKAIFENERDLEAVVVSIDIRRSTELMLKAKEPKLFSQFITELSSQLSKVIIKNYGVFDKFTGDGILAFFPIEYSGKEAIQRAIIAAKECHEVFRKHYENSRGCFSLVVDDIGLGIGIDSGLVNLVNNGREITVVGRPVVYACRMSGAEAGHTLLNQSAKEQIESLATESVKITETRIPIKNEGKAIAYEVDLSEKIKEPEKPEWYKLIEDKK